MPKLDWRNALLYGLFTGISLALLWVFTKLLAEKTGTIESAVLIVGATGGAAILLYLLLRWGFSNWIGQQASVQLRKLSDLKNRYSQSDETPLLRQDLGSVIVELMEIGPALWHYGRSILAVAVFMTVTLGLLALANAAVMYLQAKRLQEQNELLSVQNRAQQAEFVSSSMLTIISSKERAHDIRNQLDHVSAALPEAIDNLEPIANHNELGEVLMSKLTPVVCPTDLQDECDGLSTSSLLGKASGGIIEVTADNLASVKAYAQLSKVGRSSMDVFSLVFGPKEKPRMQNGLQAYGNAIAETMNTCDASGPGNRAKAIWDGVMLLGLGSMNMFEDLNTVETIQPGDKLKLDFNGIILLAQGVSQTAATFNRKDDLSGGPMYVASLFADGLRDLKRELESLVVECDRRYKEILQTVQFLSAERNCILSGFGECRRASE